MMTRFIFSLFFLCTGLLCPVASFAQGGYTPKISPIPGGFFVEWNSLVEIAAFRLDKQLHGEFEMMFDVPSAAYLTDSIDRQSPAVNNPEIATVLADYWIVRGKPERAIHLYEKALELPDVDEKRLVIFHNNLAMLYSQSGQHEKALKTVDAALETRRDNVVLLDTKGLIYLNNGQPELAIPPLSDAVELSCQDPIYCLHLATALYRTDREARARRFFDPVRPQLIAAAPKMGKENKSMFDALQIALPPQ